MATKILTPAELLAQTLVQAKKMRTPGYVDPNLSVKPTNIPVAVTPTPPSIAPVVVAPAPAAPTTPAFDYAGLFNLGETSAANAAAAQQALLQQSLDAANTRFAAHQASSEKAAYSANDAEMAYANSIINSGGIWKTLQPIADKQMQDSMVALTQVSGIAKANVEASRTALNAQEAADYDAVVKTLDDNLVAARKRTTEDMNGRGLFFSTVLESVMGQVEAASVTQKGQAAQQSKARYARIASDMAIMSANIDIEVIKGNASAVAQYTAQMLQVLAQDTQTAREMGAIVAKLTAQRAGIPAAIAAQVFSTGEQMRASYDTASLNLQMGEIQRTSTEEYRRQQDILAQQQAQAEKDKADFIATIGQYSNDYQAAINTLDPNSPLYDFEKGMLASARNTKLQGISEQDEKNFLATIGQYANDYQSQINKLANDGNTSNDWEIGYLKTARNEKIAAQLVALAESDAADAKAKALALYQSGQQDIAWFNAVTQRINAAGSATGTTKAYAPSTGAGGAGGAGSTVPKVTFNNADSIVKSFEDAQLAVQGWALNTDSGMYEKQIPDQYGGSVTRTMTAADYKILADRVGPKAQADYAAAKQLRSVIIGSQLSGDAAENANNLINAVLGKLRGVNPDSGITPIVIINSILHSVNSAGISLLQTILSDGGGDKILQALEKYFNVSITR